MLYRRHTKEVHHTIYQFLCTQFLAPDHALAEDLTQETFLRAWDNLPGKNPHSPFLAWIKVIAVNEVRQYMRKWRREIRLPPYIDPPDTSSDASLDERIELQIRIERIKQSLPKKQQIVFSLYYDMGYTPREIADALKMKPSTVWQTLWRANVRFRNLWLKEGGAQPTPPASAQGKGRGDPSDTEDEP